MNPLNRTINPYNGFSLPKEISIHIFSFLNKKDLLTCSSVCKTWQTISRQDIVWQRFIPMHISFEKHTDCFTTYRKNCQFFNTLALKRLIPFPLFSFKGDITSVVSRGGYILLGSSCGWLTVYQTVTLQPINALLINKDEQLIALEANQTCIFVLAEQKNTRNKILHILQWQSSFCSIQHYDTLDIGLSKIHRLKVDSHQLLLLTADQITCCYNFEQKQIFKNTSPSSVTIHQPFFDFRFQFNAHILEIHSPLRTHALYLHDVSFRNKQPTIDFADQTLIIQPDTISSHVYAYPRAPKKILLQQIRDIHWSGELSVFKYTVTLIKSFAKIFNIAFAFFLTHQNFSELKSINTIARIETNIVKEWGGVIKFIHLVKAIACLSFYFIFPHPRWQRSVQRFLRDFQLWRINYVKKRFQIRPKPAPLAIKTFISPIETSQTNQILFLKWLAFAGRIKKTS